MSAEPDPYEGMDPFTAVLCQAMDIDPARLVRIEYVMDGDDYPSPTVLVHLLPPDGALQTTIDRPGFVEANHTEMYRWQPIEPVGGRQEHAMIRDVIEEMDITGSALTGLIEGIIKKVIDVIYKGGYMIVKLRTAARWTEPPDGPES